MKSGTYQFLIAYLKKEAMAIKTYILVFFIVLTFSTCHCIKKCSEVICPDVTLDLDGTMSSLFLRYFDDDSYPQDGSCLEGKTIYRAYGKDWGRPGINRCGCIENNSLIKVIGPSECCEGIPQCHPIVSVFKEESMGDFYKRLGQKYKNNLVSDGCCPPNHSKNVLGSALTGLDKDLCYCEPINGNLVFNEGPVKLCSSSSEDH